MTDWLTERFPKDCKGENPREAIMTDLYKLLEHQSFPSYIYLTSMKMYRNGKRRDRYKHGGSWILFPLVQPLRKQKKTKNKKE